MLMRNKSDASYNLGISLINSQDNYKNTQSIHCLYYSVLQMMIYKLANLRYGAVPYSQQEEQSKNSSSHEWLLTKIRNEFKTGQEKAKFSENFRKLKSDRKDADYGERLFTLEDATDCRAKTELLLDSLRRIS